MFPTAVWESKQSASHIRLTSKPDAALGGSAASLQELTPELRGIDTMFGYLAVCYKNHGNIEIVKLTQLGIGINIDLTQPSAKLSERRRHLRFRLVT